MRTGFLQGGLTCASAQAALKEQVKNADELAGDVEHGPQLERLGGQRSQLVLLDKGRRSFGRR